MSNPRKKEWYYAVAHGRDGPAIYLSWAECELAVHKFSRHCFKKCGSLQQARSWLTNMVVPSRGHFTQAALRDRNRHQNHLVKQPDRPVVAQMIVDGDLSDTPLVTDEATAVEVNMDADIALVESALNPDSVQLPEKVTIGPAQVNAPLEAELSDEQREILKAVKRGENVFFTGSAGVGKSVVLRAIIGHLNQLNPEGFAVTATTGIAALNIGGRTIHSFAGCGYGNAEPHVLAKRILNNEFACERWTKTKTLLLDEVGMLGANLFDKLEYIARYIRESDAPFGGIQLVFCGDFFQLPPIGPKDPQGRSIPPTFTFDSRSWSKCFNRPKLLTRVFRQADESFSSMLNALRTGKLSKAIWDVFRSLERTITYADGIEPVFLFSTKGEVEKRNNERIGRIQVRGTTFRAVDTCGFDTQGNRLEPADAARLLETEVLAPQEIFLKVGAQVMLLRNVVQGRLVNGSVGKIIEFISTGEARERGVEIAKIKKDGDDEKVNEYEDNGKTPPINNASRGARIHVAERQYNPDVDHRLAEPYSDNMFARNTLWPLVKFTNGMNLLCAPMDFDVEGLAGNIEARRLQVPLMLAWAITVHKSQGQSIERLHVDLTRVFEYGQAYVALSRATKLETLEVHGFDPFKVKVNPRVIEWTKSWMTQDQLVHTYGDNIPSNQSIMVD